MALVVLAMLGACTASDSTGWVSQQGVTPTVSTDMASYTPSQSIIVSWTATQGNSDDWIAICTAGSADNSGFVALTLTNGQVDGSHTFAPLGAGNYEVRSYVSGSYTVIARSTFTVVNGPPPPPTATVTTDRRYYNRSAPITVSWMNTPGNADDWIALVPAGSPADSGFIALAFTNGQVNGSTTFSPITTEGDYEARAYRSGSYQILGSTTFTVASVTPSATTYAPQTPISATWRFMPGQSDDWIAITPAGAPINSGFVAVITTGGARNGTAVVSSAGLAAGNYELRAYQGGGYNLIDSVTFTVAGSPPSFDTDQATYNANAPITVTWTSMPGRQQDWIALVPAGSPPDSGFLQLTYVNGQASGSYTFSGLPAGSYEARYYQEGSFTIVATAGFDVVGGTGTCVPSSNAAVVSGIISGDLTIDATQQSNTAALSVPLGSSILFTSTRENEPSPNYGGTYCQLDTTGVFCERNAIGTDTGSGTVVVHYSVVTFSSGVTVQRGLANTGFTNPSSITLSPVNPNQTFVLLGGIAVGGSGWGNNEFARARLVDSTTLDVRTNTAGSRVAWQVVDMAGAAVQRGTTTISSAGTAANVSVTAVPSGTVVFASYTTDNGSGIAAGALSVATTMPDASTVHFQRDLTGSNIDISYEVVSLPFATYSGLTSLGAGSSSSTEPVNGTFSASTAVAVCSSQSILGQSTGSTSYNGPAVDLVGEAAATLSVGTNSVSVQRATSQASAEIPWTVIDFGHDCNGQ